MFPLFIQSIADEDDRDFMENVYDKYYYLMRKISLEIDPDNTDDIIQETSVKLISLIDRLREMDEGALVSYIALTVKTTALDFVRKKKAKQKILYQGDTEKLLEELEDEDSDPSPIFFNKLESQRTAKLMEQLPKKDRDLLMMKYFLCMKDREIAPLLGLKTDSVRKTLERARKKLLKIIEESAQFPFL